MGDLLAYIMFLFISDPAMQQIFAAAGSPSSVTDTTSFAYLNVPNLQQQVNSNVVITRAGPRIAATFPAMTITGYEQDQQSNGDGTAFRFVGEIKLQIAVQQDDKNPDPMETINQIKNQVSNLLLGNPVSSPKYPGIKGKIISGSYSVPVFKQVAPTGDMPSPDPSTFIFGYTFKVMLNRRDFRFVS